MDGLAQTSTQADKPARISIAKVVAVDTENYTVDIMTLYTHKPVTCVPFASPYCNKNHAGGIYVMPEVGSYCYIAECGDGTYVVLGFVLNPSPNIEKLLDPTSGRDDVVRILSDLPSFRGLRERLEPGEILIGTQDGNFITLRRGGMLQIGATAMAQRIYFPVDNLVRDFFQRYQALSPLGQVEWTHKSLVKELSLFDDALAAETDATITTETPVLIKYDFKEITQEDVVTEGTFTVEFRSGFLDTTFLDETQHAHLFASGAQANDTEYPFTSEPGIISFCVNAKRGAHTGEQVFKFQVNRYGDTFLLSEGSIHVEIKEDLLVTIGRNAKVAFGGNSSLELLQSDLFKAAVKNILFEVLENLVVKVAGNATFDVDGITTLGTGADDGAVRGNALLQFLLTKFTCSTALGPSGPMTIPFASGDKVISTTVKVNTGA